MIETFRISHRQIETALCAYETILAVGTDPQEFNTAYAVITEFLKKDVRDMCFCARGLIESAGATAISYNYKGSLIRLQLPELNAGEIPSVSILRWMHCAFAEVRQSEFEFTYKEVA